MRGQAPYHGLCGSWGVGRGVSCTFGGACPRTAVGTSGGAAVVPSALIKILKVDQLKKSTFSELLLGKDINCW